MGWASAASDAGGGRGFPKGVQGALTGIKRKGTGKAKDSFLYTPLLEEMMALIKTERAAVTTGAGVLVMLEAVKTNKKVRNV